MKNRRALSLSRHRAAYGLICLPSLFTGRMRLFTRIKRRTKPRRGPSDIPSDQWRSPEYRRFLREEGQCTACRKMWINSRGLMACDPAHGPPNGKGSKGPDAGCVPLCRSHHEEQTRIGWKAFQETYGFDREREAAVWFAAFKIWKEAQ